MPSLLLHGSRPTSSSSKKTQHTGSEPSSRSGTPSKGSKGASAPEAALNVTIESPPLVSYGLPKDSTGALLSGQFKLVVLGTSISVDTLRLSLVAEVTTRRPVVSNCAACTTRTTVIHTWTFFEAPVTLRNGTHSYPFSYLIPGHLPASTTSALAGISYCLVGSCTPSNKHQQPLEFTRPLHLARAILPGPDKQYIRVFPPTSLTASITLPNVVHPGSDFILEVTFTGTNSSPTTRWRLRKMTWRVDEYAKVISPACKEHEAKLGGAGKGILYEETRTVGAGEMKTGWKTDTSEGKVEAEVHCGTHILAHPACAVESAAGIAVSHKFIFEAVVVEENRPSPGQPHGAATGAARVLRLQFPLVLTDRPGLGVSWDLECPPLYEDVADGGPPKFEDVAGKGVPGLPEVPRYSSPPAAMDNGEGSSRPSLQRRQFHAADQRWVIEEGQ